MSYTNNSDNTLPMLNVDTKLLLIPDDYRSGIQDWKPSYVKAQFSIRHDLRRNYPINSLVRMKSLHSWHHSVTSDSGQSRAVHQSPRLIVEPATLNPFLIEFTPPANHVTMTGI